MSELLLIHGAWGGAWEFQEAVDGLRQRGHEVAAIDLPGHGESPAAISEVTMDAYVERVIVAAEATEGPVVLVGHSLGGAIISQVAERIPSKIERLIYVAAILPRNGETPMELMQSDEAGQLLTRLQFSEDQSYATVDPNTVEEVLLHDVKEAERLAEFLPRFAMKQATEPFLSAASLTDEAFGSVRKTYLRSSRDQVLSPALQDQMIEGWDIDEVITLESGHFPLMSMPEQLILSLHKALQLRVPTA